MLPSPQTQGGGLLLSSTTLKTLCGLPSMRPSSLRVSWLLTCGLWTRRRDHKAANLAKRS